MSLGRSQLRLPGITLAKLPIRSAAQREKCDNEAEKSGEHENQCDPAVGAGAEPAADQVEPAPVVMNGMKTSWVIGPIRNAVSGEAACSMLWANRKTRPWRS